MNKTLSIVIPTYNSARTISNCLESLAKLTFSSFDVIIIDNCSSDETLAIVDNFSQALELLVISERDGGISQAFNKGIVLANSDYILLLGSDDIVVIDSLDYVCHSLLSFPDDIDIVFTGILDPVDSYCYFTDLSRMACRNSFIHPGTFVSALAYQKFGMYDQHYLVSMDYEFFSRAYRARANILQYNMPTVIHYPGGASSNKLKCFKESFAVRKRYYGAIIPFYEIINYVPSILLSPFKTFGWVKAATALAKQWLLSGRRS